MFDISKIAVDMNRFPNNAFAAIGMKYFDRLQKNSQLICKTFDQVLISNQLKDEKFLAYTKKILIEVEDNLGRLKFKLENGIYRKELVNKNFKNLIQTLEHNCDKIINCVREHFNGKNTSPENYDHTTIADYAESLSRTKKDLIFLGSLPLLTIKAKHLPNRITACFKHTLTAHYIHQKICHLAKLEKDKVFFQLSDNGNVIYELLFAIDGLNGVLAENINNAGAITKELEILKDDCDLLLSIAKERFPEKKVVLFNDKEFNSSHILATIEQLKVEFQKLIESNLILQYS